MNLVGLLLTLLIGFSIFITFFSLFLAVIKRSWQAMLVCFIASLPISMYFLSGNPPISFLGVAPIFFLTLTVIYWRNSRNEIAQ